MGISIWVLHNVVMVQAQVMSNWRADALQTIQFDVWADTTNGAPAMGPPIVMGSALTLDCCSEFSRMGRECYRGYQMFVDWINMVRGGVLVQGMQRSVQLTLIDDHSSTDLVRQITEFLVQNGTRIFLAPYGSQLNEPASDVVNSSGGIMLSGTSSDPSIFQDRSLIFGSTAPAQQWFEGTIKSWQELGVRSVIAVQEDTLFSRSVCSGLPGLATKYGMTLTSTLTLPAEQNVSDFMLSSLGSLQDLPDVLIGCTYTNVCKAVLKSLRQHNISFKSLAFTICVTSPGFIQEMGTAGRFVLGITPWMPTFPTRSDLTGWSSSDFSAIYKERYGVEPPYQAAKAFNAGMTMIEAIVAANSTEPTAIAVALRSMKHRRSMFGNITFDEQGMSENDLKAVQFQATGDRAELVVPTTAKMVYPLPPWAIRPCFNPERGSYIESGLDSQERKHCHKCPLGELSWWRHDAWYGTPAWLCVRINCSHGYQGLKDGSCALCQPGTIGTISRTCRQCPLGSYSDTAGATACTICPKGTFANTTGYTACQKCEPGYEANRPGLSSCRPCRLGTNSSQSGAVNCELCHEGSISNTTAARTCITCDPGRYSAWGAQSCDACEVGKFQFESGKSFCVDCPNGTECLTKGSTFPANLADWYTLNYTSGGEHAMHWFACSHTDLCLTEMRCAEGQTGLLCRTCLPGYAFNVLTKGCSKCPKFAINLVTNLIIMACVCVFTYFLTAWAITAATQAKAITSALLKLLLNYVTTMSIMGAVLYRELNDRSFLSSVADPSEERDGSQANLAKVFSSEVLEFQSSVFSLECLIEPTLDDATRALVDTLSQVPQAAYWLPEHAVAREALRKFHYDGELRRLIFWVLLPWILSLFLMLFGNIRLKLYVMCNHHLFNDAGIFVKDVDQVGWKRACHRAAKKNQDYHQFMSLYEHRLMGIWKAIDYRGLRGMNFFNKFRKECEPLILIVFFLAYPYCMKAYLRPMSCYLVMDDLFGSRMESAIDVQCYQDDTLFWFSLVLIIVFGLGIPAGSGFMLYEHREKLHKPRFQRTYGFLTGGYEVDRNWWECFVLVRKSVSQIVASMGMNQGIRILLVITASSTFTLLHIWYEPFDNRFNELLDRIEFRHLICWVTFGLVLLGMHMLPAEVPAETIWAFLIFLLVVHAWFLLMMLRQVLRHKRNEYAEGVVLEAHHEQYKELHHLHMSRGLHPDSMQATLSDKSVNTKADPTASKGTRPSGKTEVSVLTGASGEVEERELKLTPAQVLAKDNLNGCKRTVLSRYTAYLDRQAYVAFHNQMLWCQILGNKGASCVVPETFLVPAGERGGAGMALPMPTEPQLPNGVDLSSEQSRRYMVKIIMEVFEYIIVNQEISVFSSTLLEFVFRAGLAFGSDGRQRQVYVTHSQNPTAKVGVNDITATAVVNAAGDAVHGAAKAVTDRLSTTIGYVTRSGGTKKNSEPGQKRVSSLSQEDVEEEEAEIGDNDVERAGRAMELELHENDKMSPNKLSMIGSHEEIAEHHKELQAECSELVRLMFDMTIFDRGLTLQEFQLNLSASVMTKTKKELRMWFELFEAEWQRRKLATGKTREAAKQGKVVDEGPEMVDVATQVCDRDISDELGLPREANADIEGHWHRFARHILLIAARRDARQPHLYSLVKSQRKLAPIQEKEASLLDELSKLNEETDRLTSTPSGGDAELTRTREELSAARAEHAQMTKEIMQLREECAARGIDISGGLALGRRD